MPEYQLQIKQVVDYPRCRIYREFIHKLINDRSIRITEAPAFFILLYFAAMQTSAPHIAVLTGSVTQSPPANGSAPSRNCLAGSAPAFIGRRCPCWIPFRSST